MNNSSSLTVTPPIFQDISIRRKHAGAYSSPKSRQTSSQGKGMSHGAPKCFLLPTPQCAKAQVSSLFGRWANSKCLQCAPTARGFPSRGATTQIGSASQALLLHLYQQQCKRHYLTLMNLIFNFTAWPWCSGS